jgi:hypothetical protein
LVDFMLANMRGMLNQVITPMQQNTQVKEALDQVKEATRKYPDFVEYKDQMIAIARRNPNISAEEAYHAAKGQNPRKPTPPKRSTGSPPAGGGSTERAPEKGFNSAFLKAWEASGLGSSGRE